MSFPHHDPAWVSASDFVARHRSSADAILAPDVFVWRYDRVYRYANTHRDPRRRYDWAVLHLAMLHELAPAFLAAIARDMRAVFANDAFVVWARDRALRPVRFFDPHLRAFFRLARRVRRGDGRYSDAAQGIEPVLPDPGVMSRFALLSIPELKRAMDLFFRHGGYQAPTYRDRAYTETMDRAIRELVGDASSLRMLDLCCGDARLGELFGACGELVNVDLSEVAVARGATRYRHRREYRFAAMDAHALAFPDGCFDVAICVDSIEHVHDAPRMVAEAARVLKPGGRFIISTQNRESLHLMVTRKLGYPEFLTSYQHIREFAYRELRDLLEKAGLRVRRAIGLGLYPYWGVPGIDDKLRRLMDDDEELVRALFTLGERGGPEHSYSMILDAVKGAVA